MPTSSDCRRYRAALPHLTHLPAFIGRDQEQGRHPLWQEAAGTRRPLNQALRVRLESSHGFSIVEAA